MGVRGQALAGDIAMRQKCLMLGAGHSKVERRLIVPGSAPEEKTDWVTLDFNQDADPDILYDLDNLEKEDPLFHGERNGRIRDTLDPWGSPIDDGIFDEIHAYEVLEHFGRQGDFLGFFASFREFWRILKPHGWFIGSCPTVGSGWEWGDPGHTRVISNKTLSFLTHVPYDNMGTTMASDYRKYVDPYWWELVHSDSTTQPGHYYFALRKL